MDIQNLFTSTNQLVDELYYELMRNNSLRITYHIVYYIIPVDDIERTEIVKKENNNIFCICLVHQLDENQYEDFSYTHFYNPYNDIIDTIFNQLGTLTRLIHHNNAYYYENDFQQLMRKFNCVQYDDTNFDWQDEELDDTGTMW